MKFDWREYIYLAERLLSNKDMASLRSAVSRAYYGVFNIARNKVDKEFLNKVKKSLEEKNREKILGQHQLIILAYEKSDEENRKMVGSLLRELRNARNEADYEDIAEIKEDDVGNYIRKAYQILSILEGLS